MLQKIFLDNYALVDRVELELGEGLNIFTGETGAGKSILIGAIAALLGEKAAFSAPRNPEKKAVVEGLFTNCVKPEIVDLLKSKSIDLFDEQTLLIRREFHPTGRSRTFVNDTPVPAAVLDELSELLVDLHGQHEHQSLLRPKTHVHYLDAFAGLDKLKDSVALAYNEVLELKTRHKDLLTRKNDIQSRRELEIFQMQEIKQIDPQPNEDDELDQEIKLLSNAERRAELANNVQQILFENENAVHVMLNEALEALEELAEIDNELKSLFADCRSAEIAIRETAQEIQVYRDRIEFDPDRLEQARQRLVEIQKLKRKYGNSVEEILNHLEQLEASLASYENLDSEISEIEDRLREREVECEKLSLELSAKRRDAAKYLQRCVPQVLQELGLPSTRFEARFSFKQEDDGFITINNQKVKAGRDGIDQIEFYISTNSGHEPAPLAKVASGGEISRIMLALKSIVAQRDDIPVLIFDEIDSGVSGRIAQAVGRRLQSLAESHQLICITHLPQIASTGRYHFLVEKLSAEDKSKTVVRRLDPNERANAIASLLGGEKISEAHIKSAKELLAEGGNAVT